MGEHPGAERIRRFLTDLSVSGPDVLKAYFGADVVWHLGGDQPGSGTFRGIDGLVEYTRAHQMAPSDQLEVQSLAVLADDEHGAVFIDLEIQGGGEKVNLLLIQLFRVGAGGLWDEYWMLEPSNEWINLRTPAMGGMEIASGVTNVTSDGSQAGRPVLIDSVPEDPPIEACTFYHFMDLPGVGAVGTGWDLRETVDDYLGNLDYKGKRVIDVGTASGFLTFALEDRGAEVVSFDMADGSQWNVVPFQGERFKTKEYADSTFYTHQAVRNSYWFAHRRLGSSAKAFYGDLYNLPEGLGHFDVAVVGMILPHLRDPFLALQNVCRLRPDTIVVTQQCPRGDQPHALFMPNRNVDPESGESYFAWWVLTETCLSNMLGVLGYRVVNIKRNLHYCAVARPHEAPPSPVPRSRFARRKPANPAAQAGMEECSTIVAERVAG